MLHVIPPDLGAKDAIIDIYQAARLTGASPREFASVRDRASRADIFSARHRFVSGSDCRPSSGVGDRIGAARCRSRHRPRAE